MGIQELLFLQKNENCGILAVCDSPFCLYFKRNQKILKGFSKWQTTLSLHVKIVFLLG